MPSCSTCVGAAVERAADGISYCSSCSRVIENDEFVAQIEFQESSGGAFSVCGTFVTNDGFNTSGSNRLSSRQITIFNAKKRIQDLAIKLQLNNSFIDRALQLYKLALNYNVTKGKKLDHVLAACLYIVCRRDNTPHILLDFSEVTDCNVFVLGSTFVSLCRSLNIQFETIIDPCIFIWRYAKKLEFGSHIKVVVDSALDLVKRMKRDWIHVGRRPDSICGAALLIAARMHNFSRSVSEIVEVVRCCDMTLRKRLSEFEVTPSASLAVSEFESIFLEEECDPPAFSRLREKSHLQKLPVLTDFSTNDEHVLSHLAGKINWHLTVSASLKERVSDNPDILDDAEDEEVNSCILTESETEAKTMIWNTLNRDFLREQEEKEKRQGRMHDSEMSSRKSKKRNQKKLKTLNGCTHTGAHDKFLSKKLNYSALKTLGIVTEDDDTSPAVPDDFGERLSESPGLLQRNTISTCVSEGEASAASSTEPIKLLALHDVLAEECYTASPSQDCSTEERAIPERMDFASQDEYVDLFEEDEEEYGGEDCSTIDGHWYQNQGSFCDGTYSYNC